MVTLRMELDLTTEEQFQLGYAISQQRRRLEQFCEDASVTERAYLQNDLAIVRELEEKLNEAKKAALDAYHTGQ